MVHQERKKRENPTHKKYEHLAPSVPNNKGACFSLILHVHIFKYTILKCCLYRASYALLGEHSICALKETKEKLIHRA